MQLRILGTGQYLPNSVISSALFDQRFGRAPGWTMRRLGVAQRHHAGATETSSFMGAQAAVQALEAAQVRASEVDCIVSACSVMEQAIPCLGSQIQYQLGLGESGVAAFDINATCLSFVVALDLIACAIAAGRYRKVLIVSSEMPSAGLNPDDHGTAALFGDGAAAVVVGAAAPDSQSRILAAQIRTYGVGGTYCQIQAGGTRLNAAMNTASGEKSWRGTGWFEMDGKAIYRLASRHFPTFMDQLLAQAGVALNGLDCIVPHQASGKALDHMIDLLHLPADRTVRTLVNWGNQVAASIPSALHHAITTGALRRGELVALLGSGAGVSIGGAVLRY
jgi:3-oxoacyl-[acyl-carrier-protein] synthase-3